ncbi:sigma-70 family RNA polymerase sigma factor [Singulisphaera sp. PoT]|uniref:sigma-70 family RNA polymerase sigma factor n=1 Tax=Singulisphaera sp. PoT TaxID=3411797 RepID=UPI003BF4DFB2
MVLRVCKSSLSNQHDAEDAFQATFLVLARKAASIRKRDSIASWLFGVATRVAARARVDAARRRKHESHGLARRADEVRHDLPSDFDLGDILRDEIRRLPDKYGAPVILCYLEGRTSEQAALDLQWPVGTVKVRLSRARDILKRRLGRRGLALPAGLLAAGLSPPSASAALPPSLIGSTVQSASAFIGHAVAGTHLSVPAITLAEGILTPMTIARLSTLAVIVLLGASAALGGVTYFRNSSAPVDDMPRRQATPKFPAEKVPPPVQTSTYYDETIREGVTAAEASEDPTTKARDLLRIAHTRYRRGDRRGGLETFERAILAAKEIPPDKVNLIPHPIVLIANSLGELGEHTRAQRTYSEAIPIIQAIRPQTQQFNHWLNFVEPQIRTEGRKSARESILAYRQFLQVMQQQQGGTEFHDVDLVRLDAHEFGPAKTIEKIFSTNYFRLLDWNYSLNKKTSLAIGVVTALQVEDGDDAKQVLAKAIQLAKRANRGRTSDFFVPDVVKTQARLGLFEEAITTAKIYEADLMAPKSSLYVDSAKFNEALCFAEIGTAQFKAGKKDEAKASARKIIEIVKTIQAPESQPHPLSRAGDIFKDAEDIQGILSVIDVFKTISHRSSHSYLIQSWLSIASIQKKAGDRKAAGLSLHEALAAAERNLQQARENPQPANRPNFDLQMQAVSQLANIQAMLGDLPTAFKTIESLEDEVLQEHALLPLIPTLLQNGETEEASRIIDRIPSPVNKRAARIEMATYIPINATLDGKTAKPAPSPSK